MTNPRPTRRDRGRSTIGVLGVPSSVGARQLGQESTPRLFRDVGVLETLRDAGLTVRDYGDLPVVPFTPDRGDRSSRNLRAVASVAREVSHAVGEIERDGALPFVIGGDCTISIGVLAGLLEAGDDLGLVYLDGDVDLNTPSTTATGILDGMGLAHVLGRGARELSTIGPRAPLLDAERIVVFGYQDAWLDDTERAQLSSTGMANFPRSVLRERPENAAAEAVRSLQQRVDRFVVHFDVDVVDHPDLPVADVPHFGGLSLVEAERCLQAFLSATGAAALVLTEFNALQDPKGAAARALAGGIGRALGSRIGNPPGWTTRQPIAAPSSRSEVGGRG